VYRRRAWKRRGNAAVEHVLFSEGFFFFLPRGRKRKAKKKAKKRFFLESQTAFALDCDHPRST